MVRENRVKVYSFQNAGSLTANSSGILTEQYSTDSINGTIIKVGIGSNNWTDTGSLYIRESGVFNEVLAVIRGTTEKVIYPVVATTLANTGAVSTLSEVQPVSRGYSLIVTGSGLGASTSGAPVNIYYI